MRWWSRFPLLIASSVLFGLSVHAAVPLVAPDHEAYVLAGALVGLLLAGFWRWSGSSLALLVSVGTPGAAFVIWRWLPDIQGSAPARGTLTTTVLTPGATLLLGICTFVLAICCGRLLFEHRTPWPAVSLACSAFLLRANVTHVYEERFPVFLVAAVAVVILCHAPGDRRFRVGFATLVTASILVVLCWQLPTTIHAWSPVFSNAVGRSIATGAPGAGGEVLPLTGAFHPSNRPVMSVVTNLVNSRPYWRVAVFDHYDGHGWSLSKTIQRVEAANQPVSTTSFRRRSEVVTAVEVFEPMVDLASAGVPVRASVPAIGQYAVASQELLTLRSAGPLPPGSVYQVDGTLDQSAPLTPTALAPYLQVPSDLSRVRALAQAITRSYSSPLLRVLALESYLRDTGRYQYDLQAGSPPDADAVDSFLFVQRRGYCNQFASALVVMSRETGIPARLVTGYATGVAVGNTYLVRERDAHSWVEAYLPNSGWLSLDPTPGFHADPALVTDPRGKLPTPPLAVSGHRTPPGTAGGLGWRRRWSNQAPVDPVAPAVSQPGSSISMQLLILLMIGGGLMWLPAYLWWPRSLEQLYQGLRRATPRRYGIPHVAETPASFLKRFSTLETSTKDIRYIIDLYIEEQYAGRSVSREALKGARRAWRHRRCLWLVGNVQRITRIRPLVYLSRRPTISET